MTQKHLSQIIDFVTPYYQKTGRFHNWDHIQSVRKNAKKLLKDFPVDPLLVDAACLIHDIGRSVIDEGHPQESARIAAPFLKEIGLETQEIDIILDAVSHHAVEDIGKAFSEEAKVLFDADKLEILSVYGFLRTMFWLMEERSMPLEKALIFLWDYCRKVQKNFIQTDTAKNIVTQEMETLSGVVEKFSQWRE